MMEEITRLSAALAERMRELRADPTDPRLAPLFAQYQALVRQHMATVKQQSRYRPPNTPSIFPPSLTACCATISRPVQRRRSSRRRH
jgi:hypothetical protein